jgi:hypothetical protein
MVSTLRFSMGLEQRCCTARCSLDGRSIDTGFYRADILCSETVSQPPILIKVGPEGRQFHVFKSLLIRYSDYFQAALRSSGTFKEAEDGIITLPDVDVETFEAFTAFLYSKLLSEKDYRYPGGIFEDWVRHPYHHDVGPENSMRILRLYVFSNRFIVPELKAKAGEMVRERVGRLYVKSTLGPSVGEIIHAFENLPSGDQLLNQFIDMYCTYNGVPQYEGGSRLSWNSCPRNSCYVSWLG